MWPFVAIFVGSLVLGLLLRPKAQTQKPPGFGEIQQPTAEEGREIGVLFGTRDFNGTNCVWWGDVLIQAIKKKAKKK